ncbi:hypothetical protein GBA52_023114 [Prunus armeniaca]|nr:hypothetical protein GBA52_023114 [Prunus armeniaca]
MGSAAAAEAAEAAALLEAKGANGTKPPSSSSSGMTKKKKGKQDSQKAATKAKKRNLPQSSEEEPSRSRKMPKRAAACKDFKDRSVPISEKSSLIESKEDQIVEEEILAVRLTCGPDQDAVRPNRRLTDFVLHDATGSAQPLEMLEVSDMFISGAILPLNESSDKDKERGVRCEGFRRIESWDISGYEDGSP